MVSVSGRDTGTEREKASRQPGGAEPAAGAADAHRLQERERAGALATPALPRALRDQLRPAADDAALEAAEAQAAQPRDPQQARQVGQQALQGLQLQDRLVALCDYFAVYFDVYFGTTYPPSFNVILTT